ncbi:MAG: amidohydrolase family protein, partial [Candidatus Marinimicrobia bacterium]|nr:amidohydrolase family protein [Candidatus Neomarinimicrobiota bacterium]
MSDQLLIRNCKLFNAIEQDGFVDILIESGSIVQIGKVNERREYASVINANGGVTAPGFIDIHIQGAGGADILDGTEEALVTMSRTLARLGTTSFLATTVVKPDRNNRHLKVTARNVNRELGGAIILGMHLEGPFINLKKSGGISKNSIFSPSLKALKEIRDIAGDTLKMMTIAPEIEGNLGIIYKLVEDDVIASFGHSNATYIETKKGFSA